MAYNEKLTGKDQRSPCTFAKSGRKRMFRGVDFYGER
jgi:hypothetical protein